VFTITSERGSPITTAGFALANKGNDTGALQAFLGRRNIQHKIRYTELASDRFRNFWRDLRQHTAHIDAAAGLAYG